MLCFFRGTVSFLACSQKGSAVSINSQKFVLLLLGLGSTVLLMLTNTISSDVGFPVISAITMYTIGNGIAAKSGKVSEPVIAPKRSEGEDHEATLP